MITLIHCCQGNANSLTCSSGVSDYSCKGINCKWIWCIRVKDSSKWIRKILIFIRKFGEVSVEFKFPKPIITSKMISIQEGDALLISCLSKNPLVLYKDRKLIIPAVEKNPLLPMKPIQKLQTMTESKGILVLGHGERCLEFAKLDFEDDFLIHRTCQKSSQVSYSVREKYLSLIFYLP